MKAGFMDFPELGIRLKGSNADMNKKSRILTSTTESFVAYSKMNRAHEAIFHQLQKAASSCNTSDLIEMNTKIGELRKGLSDFEQAFAELYEASIEEELPDECFNNNPDDVL